MSAIAAVSVPPIAVPHAASHEFARIAPDVARYLTPPVDDRCPLLEVPEEVMVKVFEKLGRGDMTTCRRVCKSLHDLLTNTPALALSHLLAASSLRINPNALLPVPNKPRLLPPSPAQLLEMLQKRLDRMSRFEPRKSTVIRLKEEEGRLYEYIEGILLRGTGGANGNRSLPQEMAVYDLRKLGEWEDEEETDGEMTEEEAKAKKTEETRAAFTVKGDGQSSTNLDGTGEANGQDEEEVVDEEDLADTLRSTKKFGFEIAEFAVDPGQDLLVVVQIETLTPTSHNMFIHLKTLSTFEPHPRAPAEPLKWPAELPRRKVELGFQICDDGLYALRHNQRIGSTDRLCGWQWTTGRLAVTLGASPVMSFESFVMLTPTSFIVPVVHTRLDTNSIRANVLTDPSDLSWTHHLHIYAFPPFSSTAPQTTSEPLPPPHTATLVRIVDMPSFHVDLLRDIPPPRMNIRCDPPPRETFPTHPVENVQPFIPEPTTGIYTIEFACQTPEMPFPHYVMIIPRQALLPHVPPRDSPILRQARPRPATVVSWDRFRHHVRLFGHEMIPSAWVCYVYHNRYIAPIRRDRSNDPEDMEEDDRYDMDRMRLYDFDPLRVKRELLERTHADPAYISPLELVRSARPSGDMQSIASTGSSHIDLLTGDLVTGSASNPTSPTSPSGAPSSPSKARSFIRRLSSTFKRSRLHSPEKQGEELPKPHKYDGEHKSITLITAETVLAPNVLLHTETRTGSKFPYTYVDKFEGITSETVLIDDERIVVVNDGDDGDEDWGTPRTKTVLQVYEF